jgi:hypothetical protein
MKHIYVVLGMDGGVCQGGIATPSGAAADEYERALLVDHYGEEIADKVLAREWESGDYEVVVQELEVHNTVRSVKAKIARGFE